jgi:hypothetical protein
MSLFSVISGIVKLRGKTGNVIDSVTHADGLERLATDSHIIATENASYYPSPDSKPTGNTSHVFVDSAGSLQVRGPVLTDEVSFRDDFGGSSLYTDLTGTVTFTNGSATVTGSGTAFLSEVNLEHLLRLSSHADTALVAVGEVVSDTEIELSEPYAGANGSGTAVKSFWIAKTVTGGTVSVVTSKLNLVTNTASGAIAQIKRIADFPPFLLSFNTSISQRIANQSLDIGFADDPDAAVAEVELVFSGTDNTKVNLYTSASSGESETNTFTLPGGLVTSSAITYQIEVTNQRVALFVNGTFAGENQLHIPGPYTTMSMYAKLKNTGATASTTTAVVDVMWFNNFNRLEIASSTKGDPLSTRVVEDTHYVTGVITTTATTADQVIVSYTVPAGKTFWLAGYMVNNGETTIRGVPVKVGRNTVTGEPAGPGTLDGNILRVFNMAASTFRDEWFGSSPIRCGAAGDVMKITVTPSGGTTTIWRASMTFVLR